MPATSSCRKIGWRRLIWRATAEVEEFSTWLRQYRNRWGVSGEVILRRLLDAGHVAQYEYEHYRTWSRNRAIASREGGSREWRHREPKHMFGEPFVRTVLDALNARQITPAPASTYLDNLKVRDIHKL